MEWASVGSEHGEALKALDECARKVQDARRDPPDLAVLFPSVHHGSSYSELPKELLKRLGPKQLIGCSGGGVIAGGTEFEQRPGMSLVCAWLPGVEIHPFRLEQAGMPSPDAAPKLWREWLGVPAEAQSFLILSDPFSLQAEDLLRGLDFAYPRAVKIGGLASGAAQPGANALFLNGRSARAGAVGAAFTGNITLDAIVAQGCRPIGSPLKVTQSERNVLIQLDGGRTLDVLERVLQGLPEKDQRLARHSLFIGLLGDPMKSGASKRDFLIRNLIGMDTREGVLAIGAEVRPGQTVQFHLRDGETSAEDLGLRLDDYLAQDAPTKPRGALLFSCLGRGRQLYQKANHDSDLFQHKLGPVALGGFFCNGEIGPVDGNTYLHGYTSCFGIFRAKETP